MFGLSKNVTKRDIIKSISNLKANYVDTGMILKRKKRKKRGNRRMKEMKRVNRKKIKKVLKEKEIT